MRDGPMSLALFPRLSSAPKSDLLLRRMAEQAPSFSYFSVPFV